MEKPMEKQEKEQTQASQQESKPKWILRGEAYEKALRSLMESGQHMPTSEVLELKKIDFRKHSKDGE